MYEETNNIYFPLSTHRSSWTETRANSHAKKYFEKYYGVNWNAAYLDELNNTYNILRRYDLSLEDMRQLN